MKQPINIGSRREVFWDDTMVDCFNTTSSYLLHEPIRRENVLTFDDPWSGHSSGHFMTVIKDGDEYRLYSLINGHIQLSLSKDGVHWEKPDLGQFEFEGSKHNNVLNIVDRVTGKPEGTDAIRPFIDDNPNCDPNERYKAAGDMYSGKEGAREELFVSPDGIHFTDKCMIKVRGSSFDSVNTILYNKHTGKYETWIRDFHADGINPYFWKRDVRHAAAEDLLGEWPKTGMLFYEPFIDWQMYTNGVSFYPRADHIYVGFPSRYIERPWMQNYEDLCGLENRRERFKSDMPRRGTALTDTLFMTSRDGEHWKRYADAFIRPGPEHPTGWVYGSVDCSHGVVETPDGVLSFYCAENRWFDMPCQLYRYTLRLDGFVSQHADYKGAKLTTKPLIFEGSELLLNFSTSAVGSIKLTIRNTETGDSITTDEIFGDNTDRRIRFTDGNISDFSGKPVVLEFEMVEADVYAFKFQ